MTAPDYFGKFVCKCDKCRRVCCSGWGITLSEKEYFTLLGINCGKKLRHRLDCAFEPIPLGEPERYARVNPDYNGNCPLLDTDGYCLLQKERGEDALPLICRVYPRSVKRYGNKTEVCTSNSCEKTIELLIETTEPLQMVPVDLTLPFDGIRVYDEDSEKDAVRRESIRLITDRSLPFYDRLERLCDYIRRLSNTPEPAFFRPSAGADAIGLVRRFVLTLRERSRSIEVCSGKALALLGNCDDATAYEKFTAAKEHLYTLIPHLDDYTEKLMVNHMIYEGFPYIADAGSPAAACSALLFSLALLRFLCVFGMVGDTSSEDLVDIISEAYRFVEHSGFYALASNRLHPDCVRALAELAPLLRGRAL